jgi:hypothetical protein
MAQIEAVRRHDGDTSLAPIPSISRTARLVELAVVRPRWLIAKLIAEFSPRTAIWLRRSNPATGTKHGSTPSWIIRGELPAIGSTDAPSARATANAAAPTAVSSFLREAECTAIPIGDKVHLHVDHAPGRAAELLTPVSGFSESLGLPLRRPAVKRRFGEIMRLPNEAISAAVLWRLVALGDMWRRGLSGANDSGYRETWLWPPTPVIDRIAQKAVEPVAGAKASMLAAPEAPPQTPV